MVERKSLYNIDVAREDIREVNFTNNRSRYLSFLNDTIPFSSYEMFSQEEVNEFDITLCNQETTLHTYYVSTLLIPEVKHYTPHLHCCQLSR